jgi:hypothetical protein
MRQFRIIRVVAMLALLVSLAGCRTTPMSKQEAADWYARYSSMVRWVGYQGSDEQYHYFIARVMDEWNFIRINRAELKVEDEQPYSKASSAPLFYYLVDPSREYQRIDVNKSRESGAANRSQPVREGANQTSPAAGSGA